MKVLFTGLGSIGQRHLRNLRHIMGNSIEVIAYRVKRQVPVLDDSFQIIGEVNSIAKKYNVGEFNDLENVWIVSVGFKL